VEVITYNHSFKFILPKTKDSDGEPSQKGAPLMKISLFYKPLTIKGYIFVAIFIYFVSITSIAYAGFLSDFVNSITGSSVQAAEEEEPIEEEPMHNSQNIPLFEASVDPDMKNMKDTPVVMIMEDEALYPTDFFVGSGLESISSGEITVYEVKPGDSLSQIAEDFDVSQNTIRWENNLSGSAIKVGQKLNILPVTGVKHIVKKGDNFSKIASQYDAELEDMLVYNGLTKDSGLKVGDTLFVPNGVIKAVVAKTNKTSGSSKTVYSSSKAPAGYYVRPAVGPITSPYGSRRSGFHYGVDIGNKRGTAVVSAASGVVVNAVGYCKEGVSNCGGRYGNYITIQHPNGTKTKYAHLQKVSVSVGQNVSQGELIGTLGNTGRSTGPHLHFEVINSNGSTMKPTVY
jgi:murein DD-endopeptidase MepM/ murein hydrolase activator NlpD